VVALVVLVSGLSSSLSSVGVGCRVANSM
jgi:hypothetical protein